jgi:hypothetical protein
MGGMGLRIWYIFAQHFLGACGGVHVSTPIYLPNEDLFDEVFMIWDLRNIMDWQDKGDMA